MKDLLPVEILEDKTCMTHFVQYRLKMSITRERI